MNWMWLCRIGFHDWVYSVFRPVAPECGGAVPCYYEKHCERCGLEEKGEGWF